MYRYRSRSRYSTWLLAVPYISRGSPAWPGPGADVTVLEGGGAGEGAFVQVQWYLGQLDPKDPMEMR